MAVTDRFASNEETVAYMNQVAVAGSGFSRFLAAEIVTCWQGRSEHVIALRPDLTQHHGYAHGAVIGAAADNACAWAAASVAGDVVTGSYTINFLAPAIGERLRAVGEVVKTGRRQVVVRAEVRAEREGRSPVLVAVAQATVVPTGSAG